MTQKNLLLIATILLVTVKALVAQPTDNPVATFYNSSQYASEGYPSWTDSIKWSNVINMATYSNGANDFEKFENARDILYIMGGGVLYYPAGTYNFANHPSGPDGRGLMLKKGIVIRGEAPSSNKWAVNTSDKTDDSGLSNLTTVFEFPTWDKKTTPLGEFTVRSGNGIVPRTWNHVGLQPVWANGERIKDVNYVGICWVKFRYATVYFGGDMAWADTTWAAAGAWKSSSAKTTNEYGENWSLRRADGTHPFDPFTGAAPGLRYYNGSRCRMVFGCRFENAVVHDDIWYHGNNPATSMYGYFGSRFVARVVVDGENVFIANNIIPKPTECFLFDMAIKMFYTSAPGQWYDNTEMSNACNSGCPSRNEIKTVMYDYARSIGFDVNKSLNSQRNNRCLLLGTDRSPYYSENVVIQDNFTWQHGNKGYEIAGKWAVIRRNVRSGEVLNAYNHAYGCDSSRISDNVYGLSTMVNPVAGRNRGWFNSLSGGPDCKYSDDNMARGMDLMGWCMWINDNYIRRTGSWPGVDGEGLLFQRQGCVEVFSVSETNNNFVECGGTAGGFIHPYDVHIMGMLQAWNNGTKTGNYCKTGDLYEDFSVFSNTNSTYVDCSNGPDGLFLDAQCPASAVNAPTNVTVLRNDTTQCNIIIWTDNAVDEMGFLVQRREEGTTEWTNIAYRPLNNMGAGSGTYSANSWTYPGADINSTPRDPICGTESADLNPQEWRDYFINPAKTYQYRIIAISCTQGDTTGRSAVATDGGVSVPYVTDNITYYIWPTVSDGIYNLRIENNTYGNINISVTGTNGMIISQETITKPSDVLNAFINISSAPAGVYLIHLSGDHYQKTTKVIKK